MSNTGLKIGISRLASSCAERQEMGLLVRNAIDQVYEKRRELEAAQKQNEPDLRFRVADLQAARAELLNAQLAYDQHLRAHGCLPSQLASAPSESRKAPKSDSSAPVHQ